MDIKTDNVQKDSGQDVQKDTKTDIKTNSFLKEINMKGEFDKLTKVINPKEKEKDDENECGACHGKFSGTSKFCPHCGVEFE